MKIVLFTVPFVISSLLFMSETLHNEIVTDQCLITCIIII